MSYNGFGLNSGIAIEIIETGELFDTRTQCAEALGVTVGMVSMCLSGKVKSCRGYHIRAVEMVIEHHLTSEMIDELYLMTGDDCWEEHPYRTNVYVSYSGNVAKTVRGKLRLCNQHIQNSGYLTVSVGDKLSGDSLYLVHRLVAETFIEKPSNKDYVNHKDGDKLNNCVDNLEWCTRSENMQHAFSTGLRKTERIRIVETGDVFDSATDCARSIGGTLSGIHDCKTGRQKQHRGYSFEFLGGE